ncbi:hypothetical protein Hanom_Chr06g00539181 [Helianthus anomalus]
MESRISEPPRGLVGPLRPKRGAMAKVSFTVATTDANKLVAESSESVCASSSATIEMFSLPNDSDSIQLIIACTLQSVYAYGSISCIHCEVYRLMRTY